MDSVNVQANNPTAMNAPANTNGTNNSAGTGSTKAAGNASFTQTLVQILNDGSGTGTNASTASMGSLMPGLLVGMPADSQEQSANPAEALMQLLTQLLSGEGQGADTQSTEDITENGSESDPSTAMAQLQLLLMQWMASSQAAGPNKSQNVNGTSESTVQLDGGDVRSASAQLLQILEALTTQRANAGGLTPSSSQTLADLFKPVLAEVAAAVASTANANQTQAAASGVSAPATLAMPLIGDSFNSANRKAPKETSSKEATTSLPLVHVIKEGRSYSGLSWLAAKASLQAPVPAPLSGTNASAMGTEPDVLVETAAGNVDSHDDTQSQTVFRMPTSVDTVVKADAPVVSANRFAQEMGALLKSMNIQNTGGQSSIKITLTPEHLGQIDVKMSMQNGHLVAQFMADSVHGKDLLESQLPQLRAVLQSQGLQVDRLEVTQGQSAAFAHFQEQRQQQSSQQFNRKSQGKAVDGDDVAIDFDAELAQLAARRAALAGSSFDASA